MQKSLPISCSCLFGIALMLVNFSLPAAFGQEAKPAAAAEDSNIRDINDYRVDNKVAVKLPAKAEVKTASVKQKLLALPTAVGGAVVGVTVGVPVRIARDVAHETLRMRDQMTDDVAGDEKPDMVARFVGSYSGMAYGLVSGIIKGSIKGTERGIEAGSRKPFSRESVSLKDPD